jgi:hypothetical protein
MISGMDTSAFLSNLTLGINEIWGKMEISNP